MMNSATDDSTLKPVISLPPAFAETLRQLTSDEVRFLDRCFDQVSRTGETVPEDMTLGAPPNMFWLATGNYAGFDTNPTYYEEVTGMIEHAVSLGLIERLGPPPGRIHEDYRMTRLGFEFVWACRAAQKKGC